MNIVICIGLVVVGYFILDLFRTDIPTDEEISQYWIDHFEKERDKSGSNYEKDI